MKGHKVDREAAIKYAPFASLILGLHSHLDYSFVVWPLQVLGF